MTIDDATPEELETGAPVPAGPFDEQTLGRSASVFDAGVEFIPTAIPPMAPPPGGYGLSLIHISEPTRPY